MLDYHDKYHKKNYEKVRSYTNHPRTQNSSKNSNSINETEKYNYKNGYHLSNKRYRPDTNYNVSMDYTQGKLLKNQIIPNKNIKLSSDRPRYTDKERTNHDDGRSVKSKSSFKMLTFETSVNWYDMTNDGSVKGGNLNNENQNNLSTVTAMPNIVNPNISKWVTEVYGSEDNLKSKSVNKLNPYIENDLKSNNEKSSLIKNKFESQQKFNKYQNTGKPNSSFNEQNIEILPSKLSFTKSATPVLIQGPNLNGFEHIKLCQSSANSSSLNLSNLCKSSAISIPITLSNSNNQGSFNVFNDNYEKTNLNGQQEVLQNKLNSNIANLKDNLYPNSNKYSIDLPQFNAINGIKQISNIDNSLDVQKSRLILPSAIQSNQAESVLDSNNYGESFTNFDVFNYDHQKSNVNIAEKINQFNQNEIPFKDNLMQFVNTDYNNQQIAAINALNVLKTGQIPPVNILIKEPEIARDSNNFGANFTNFDVIDYNHQKVDVDTLKTVDIEKEDNQIKSVNGLVADDHLAAQLKVLADMISGPANAEDHSDPVVDTSINLTGNKWVLIPLDAPIRQVLSQDIVLEKFHKKDPRLEFLFL